MATTDKWTPLASEAFGFTGEGPVDFRLIIKKWRDAHPRAPITDFLEKLQDHTQENPFDFLDDAKISAMAAFSGTSQEEALSLILGWGVWP